MSTRIIFFGRLTEIAGSAIDIEGVEDTDSVIRVLHSTYPLLAESKYMIAVNKQVIHSNTLLDKNSVVALLPPYSGG